MALEPFGAKIKSSDNSVNNETNKLVKELCNGQGQLKEQFGAMTNTMGELVDTVNIIHHEVSNPKNKNKKSEYFLI